jgi:hypothetical protein
MTDRWITAAAFARLVGCSKPNVTQSIQRGRIKVNDLRRDGRNTYINTRAVADWQATSTSGLPALAWAAPAAAVPPPPDWQQIAAAANPMLDPDLWGPPPWPADRWATLAMVLSLATDGE